MGDFNNSENEREAINSHVNSDPLEWLGGGAKQLEEGTCHTKVQ